MFNRSLVVLVVAALGGCATAVHPTMEQLSSADYGECPAHYMDAIHAYFDSTLKDPASVQYRDITVPEKGYIQSRTALESTGQVTYGWLVNATINAKNSYGGYVGFRTYEFLFRGEQIVDTLPPEAD